MLKESAEVAQYRDLIEQAREVDPYNKQQMKNLADTVSYARVCGLINMEMVDAIYSVITRKEQ